MEKSGCGGGNGCARKYLFQWTKFGNLSSCPSTQMENGQLSESRSTDANCCESELGRRQNFQVNTKETSMFSRPLKTAIIAAQPCCCRSTQRLPMSPPCHRGTPSIIFISPVLRQKRPLLVIRTGTLVKLLVAIFPMAPSNSPTPPTRPCLIPRKLSPVLTTKSKPTPLQSGRQMG